MQPQEFVNSRSMLTPGLAGGLVMFLANSLIAAFSMEAYLSFFVLGLSFIVGIVAFMDNKIKIIYRFALYIINSLIIFSMAFGTNSIGEKVTEGMETKIEPLIKPIGSIEQSVSVFVLTQNVQPDTANKAYRVRLESMRNQIKAVSNSILLVQEELVANQKIYTQPQKKLDGLIAINNSLVAINKALQQEADLTPEKTLAIQKSIVEVQRNMETMQKGLLMEKKNPVQRQSFFKDWKN